MPILLNNDFKKFWKEKFDILEAIRIIQKAWSEDTQRQLISAWWKLCPSFAQGDGGDQGDTPEITDKILTIARDLELEEGERGPMPTSDIKDLLNKWEDVGTMVLEWHPNQADVNRIGDLYNDNAINYFRKILKKREK
ncbi:tigger transposable element-derived protein 1-like protein [Trichonephila clavipes]|uniref:Tigger transposable element-derived protein 1-like protein n=1 Tax=Trichonephila clavipes TaxID=2585209 RepID=A0A8X6R2Q6_TRICX|nr:tigger transposable element-derived protein 1-like protein [Trichonephila clavipes]